MLIYRELLNICILLAALFRHQNKNHMWGIRRLCVCMEWLKKNTTYTETQHTYVRNKAKRLNRQYKSRQQGKTSIIIIIINVVIPRKVQNKNNNMWSRSSNRATRNIERKKNSERKYSIPTRPPNASRIRVRSSDYWLRYSRQTPQPCSAESEWSRFDDLYGVWRLPFIYICMCVLVLLLSQQQIVTLK